MCVCVGDFVGILKVYMTRLNEPEVSPQTFDFLQWWTLIMPSYYHNSLSVEIVELSSNSNVKGGGLLEREP